MLLNNPMVPLTFRAIIWTLSLVALALAVTVFQYSNDYEVSQKPSTVMAIVVDVVALIYLIWITYDEYSGKPLGLRSPKAKMKLSKHPLPTFLLVNLLSDKSCLTFCLSFWILRTCRWHSIHFLIPDGVAGAQQILGMET